MEDINEFDEFDELEHEPEEKSKSQIKRELLALQVLGKELMDLSDKQLAKIPLPDNILQAVLLGQTLKRGALKRHSQYLGKILRKVEIEPIQEALLAAKNQSDAQNAYFHRLEKLRDGLIANDKGALDKVFSEYPETDRQHLHQLIRNAQKEKALNKPPAAARELFKYLRSLKD